MEVTVTAIHCTLPDSLDEHAARLGRRLDRYGLKAAMLAVSFAKVNGLRTAEARLSSAGNPPIIARGDGPTYRNALNQVLDRVERQVKRARAKTRQGRRAGATTD